MNRHRHLIDFPADAINYICGGNGRATLVGHHSRYTYRFGHPDKEQFPIFVSLLTGADNTNSYHYIGYIQEEKGSNFGGNHYVSLNAGRKGNAAHPGFKAIDWYINKAQAGDPNVCKQAEFWHEGSCCRCGRALTVPASIEAGIGPRCAQKLCKG